MDEVKKKKRGGGGQLLLTAAASAGIFLLLFLLRDLWPVGNGSILMTDLYSQYVPLLYRFYDVVSGVKGLFMDFSVSGGANLYVETISELVNPFNYLLFLFGRERIWQAVNLLLLACGTASAVTACFALQKLWPEDRRYHVALSLSYALSGYMAYQFQIIRWLFLPVVFPLYFLALLRTLKKNRWIVQSLLLAYQLALSLQLGVMTLLFTLFGSAFWMWMKKGDVPAGAVFSGKGTAEEEETSDLIRRACASLAAGTVTGLFLAAPVWIPQVLFLLHSLRGGETSLLSVMSRHGLDDLFERLFQIFQPVPLAMAAVSLWKIRKNDGRLRAVLPREGKILLLWNGFLWLTVIAQPSNLLWHLGSYMCFPVRYAYMVIWSGLLTAKWLAVMAKKGENGGMNRPCFRLPVCRVLSVLLPISLGGLAIWGSLRYADRLSQAFSSLAISMTCPKETVLAAGILLLLFVCALTAACAGREKTMLLTLASLSGGLCVFLFLMLPADNTARQLNEAAYMEMTEMYEAAQREGQGEISFPGGRAGEDRAGLVRREDDLDFPLNAPLVTGGYSMAGYFPSGSEEHYAGAMEALGYLVPWVSVRSWGGTAVSDALLGIERQDMSVPGGCLSLEGSPEEIQAAFASACEDGPLSVQAWLGELPTGEGVMDRIPLETLFREEEGDFLLSLEKESLVYLDAGIPAAGLSVWVDGEEIMLPERHLADGPHRLLYLGSFPAGEVSVCIRDGSGNLLLLERMELGILDRTGWDAAAERMRASEKTDRAWIEKGMEIRERRGELLLRPSASAGGRTLFVPVAAGAGWTVEMDGIRQEPERLFGGFLGVYVPEGTERIVFRFTPPGLYAGLVSACAGLLLLILGGVAGRMTPGGRTGVGGGTGPEGPAQEEGPGRKREAMMEKNAMADESSPAAARIRHILIRIYAVVLLAALLGIYVIPNVGLLICMCRKVIRRLLLYVGR